MGRGGPPKTHPLELLHLIIVKSRQSRVFQPPYVPEVQQLQLAAVTANRENTVCPQRGRHAHDPAQIEPLKTSTTFRERRDSRVRCGASAADHEWGIGCTVFCRPDIICDIVAAAFDFMSQPYGRCEVLGTNREGEEGGWGGGVQTPDCAFLLEVHHDY